MLDDSGDPDFMDEYGLREAYDEIDGIAVHGEYMFISGTRLDRLSGLRDVLDDVTFLPLRKAYNTQRYQQALAALKRSNGRIKYLVGHSLGGAVAAALTERFPELEARVYGAPLLRSSTSVRVKSFRHQYDPISMLDRGATVSKAPGRNPHTYKGY